jgi:hypothetical protein
MRSPPPPWNRQWHCVHSKAWRRHNRKLERWNFAALGSAITEALAINDELVLKAVPSYSDYTNLLLAALVSYPLRSLYAYRHVAEALLRVAETVEVIDGA